MHDLLAPFSDAVGIVGVILTLGAYYLLNVSKITSDSYFYLYSNLVGSCCLMFSLMFTWNLASVLIEIAWISISSIGIYRAVQKRKLKMTKNNNEVLNNLYVLKDVTNKH